MVELFDDIGAGQWLRHVVGGLLVPRLAGLAALGLAGVMAGAVLTQAVVLGTPAMGRPVVGAGAADGAGRS